MGCLSPSTQQPVNSSIYSTSLACFIQSVELVGNRITSDIPQGRAGGTKSKKDK